MLLKIRQDLDRSMLAAPQFHYSAIDFAVGIASLIDWTFHYCAKNNPTWAAMKPKDGLKAFVKYIAEQNIAVAAFTDLANEFKHADRNKPSITLAKLTIVWVRSASDLESRPEWIENSIRGRSSNGMVMIPFVGLSDGRFPFYKAFAMQALDWWSAFDAMAPIV